MTLDRATGRVTTRALPPAGERSPSHTAPPTPGGARAGGGLVPVAGPLLPLAHSIRWEHALDESGRDMHFHPEEEL